MKRALVPALAAMTLLPSLAPAAGPDSTYRAGIAEWRRQHEAALKADGGWLTVTGLFWLREGPNSVGSGAANDIVLPSGAPARLGLVKVEKDRAVFTASTDAVTLNGKPVREAPLRYAGPVDVISSGPVDLFPIKRGERLALRMKDKNSALRKSFTHLSWFPVREDWKISGKFVPLPQHAKLVFDTVIGQPDIEESPGYVEFQRGDRTYRLQAADDEGQLFFVMRDLTSGKSTYAASRFLYADPPKNGVVILDFNKAENPPCAFTPYATCPLPPPQNRLVLAIEAGEMKYEGSAH
jgi:uncharacterized protein (DUF1684 family)